MLPFIVITLVVVGFGAFHWWITRSEEKRAHEWVASFHGEKLPPAETLKDKGHSTTFLLTLMPFYMEQGRKERAPVEDWARAPLPEPFPPPKWDQQMLEKVRPLDPDKEDDCPECANIGRHQGECRSGWKEILRHNVRDYAVAKFGSMPAWKKPCDTCGGNCGQCASSHCGICGVKPHDGECDIVQHEAAKLHHENTPDRASMRCSACGLSMVESVFDGTKRLWSDWSCLTCGLKQRRA